MFARSSPHSWSKPSYIPTLPFRDFNNDTLFFPVHHANIEHWALIRFDWDGLKWVVQYIDSLSEDDSSSSSRGDRFVTAVQEVLKSYFTRFRDDIALDTRSSRRFPTPRILDQKKFHLKRQASFHRNHTTSTHRQVDSFNCGCFLLHYVECALGNVDVDVEMPRTSSYMEFYRQRILLSLCAL